MPILEILTVQSVKIKDLTLGYIDPRVHHAIRSISFEYMEGEAILLMMNEFGICAFSGPACTSGSLEPSHVLQAMGVPFTAAHGSIRFSLSTYNTEKEIDVIIEKMPRIIGRLRELSPFWRQAQQQAATEPTRHDNTSTT